MHDYRPVLERGRMYKLGEVAAILNVSVNTVRRWVRGGVLPARKIGRLWFVYGGDLVPEESAASGHERPGSSEIQRGGVKFGSREATHHHWLFAKGQTEVLQAAYQRLLLQKGKRWLVLKSLLWGVIDTLDSFLPLAQRGKLRDCYVLARSAFESMVNICFICAEGDEAAERALRYAQQRAYRDLDREVKIGESSLALKWTGEVDLDNYPELKSAIAEFTSQSGREKLQWTPETVVQKIEAVDTHYGRQASVDLQFACLAIYRDASEIAHGSYFGILFTFGVTQPGGPPTSKQEWEDNQRKSMSLLLMMLGAAARAVISVLAEELPELQELADKSRQVVHKLAKTPWAEGVIAGEH